MGSDRPTIPPLWRPGGPRADVLAGAARLLLELGGDLACVQELQSFDAARDLAAAARMAWWLYRPGGPCPAAQAPAAEHGPPDRPQYGGAILARAEAFASREPVLYSIADGLGMGIGFTLALCLISGIREVLGNGTFLGYPVFGPDYEPAITLILAPGAFLTLGLLIGLMNYLSRGK